MEVVVELLELPDARVRETLETAVTAAFARHPFLKQADRQVRFLTVKLAMDLRHRTAIEHSRFASSGEVLLRLNECYLRSGIGEPFIGETGEFHPMLVPTLLHEAGHFLDARLTSAFGYADSKLPNDRRLTTVTYHLWDGYIDGRLGSEAPYTFLERAQEAWEISRLPEELVRRAWIGRLATYDSLLAEAMRVIGA